MRQSESFLNRSVVVQACASANREGRPLYFVVLATKPCYIKLASLIHALLERDVPFLLIDTGQHYEAVLSSAKIEFEYHHLIAVHLNIRGNLLTRTADLAHKLQWLADELLSAGLRQPAIPIVSGDTSTAGLLPTLWYLLTGCRAVHVEAGLRSLGPEMSWEWENLDRLLSQRQTQWKRFRDDPFPEGVDTTLASVASDLLFAPVKRNAKNLIDEGYESEKIHVVGSLSADAVGLALTGETNDAESSFLSELSNGKWLRVDIHRRENTTAERLRAILHGIAHFSENGAKVVLIRTNALDSGLKRTGEEELLRTLTHSNFVVQSLWPSYCDVVRFINSPNCAGIFTDSGGLQEEANVLGIPCVTCRYSTDRPETVLDSASNLLLPPASAELITRGLEAVFLSDPRRVWPDLGESGLYGESVGRRIADILSSYIPPPPAKGAEVVFG